MVLREQQQQQQQHPQLNPAKVQMQQNAERKQFINFVFGITPSSEPLPPYHHPNMSPKALTWLNEVRDQTLKQVCTIHAFDGYLN